MFIAVTSEKKSPEKLFLRLFSRSFKLLPIAKRGASFLRLELKSPSSIKNKKILSLIGMSPVIFGNGVEPPANRRFNYIDDGAYSLKLLQNGIKLLLSEKKLAAGCKTAILIDLKCKYQELADILLGHFGTLKIVTSRKALYKNYVDTKLYECGAAVIIQESLDKLDKSALYVSPSGILFSKINTAGISVVSINPIGSAKANIIHSFRATTPTEYKEVLPKDINEHLFQAALYGYCGKRGLCELYPTSVTVNENPQGLETNLKLSL